MYWEEYKHLIYEILLITHRDIKSKEALMFDKMEALQFLHSEWFEFLCAAVELDPSAVREQLKKDVKTRKQSKKFSAFVSKF